MPAPKISDYVGTPGTPCASTAVTSEDNGDLGQGVFSSKLPDPISGRENEYGGGGDSGSVQPLDNNNTTLDLRPGGAGGVMDNERDVTATTSEEPNPVNFTSKLPDASR
jgi:hypothetical protein